MIGTFPLRLGDLASWVGSVVTGVALVMAFWQLLILRRDRDAHQASQLSMWVSGTTRKPCENKFAFDVDLEISFMNVSTQPFGCVLYEVRLGSQKQRGKVGPVAPDGQVRKQVVAFVDLSIDDANATAEIDIWFTDEAGHRWSRNHTGRLKEGVKPPSDWTEVIRKWGNPQTNDTDNGG